MHSDSTRFVPARAAGAVLLIALALLTLTLQGRPEAPRRRDPPNAPIVPVAPGFKIGSGPDNIGGHPTIAFDGTNFMVVYLDGGAYASRVTTAGVLLDAHGIEIDPSSDGAPSVAFGGTNYMVVWMASGEIRAARVTPQGDVLDDPALTLVSGVDPARSVAIAFDGTNFLIAWRLNLGTPFEIRAARVSQSGVLLDAPNGFAVGNGRYPWIAYGGGQYLVVWHGPGFGPDIYGARILPDGTVLDPGGFAIFTDPEDQDHASVASDGTDFFVAWHDYRGGNSAAHNDGSTWGARVSAAGVVLDPQGITLADYARGQPPTVVVFDGTNYVTVWQTDNYPARQRNTDVYARRVSPSGVVQDALPLPLSASTGHQWAPTIGYGGGRYLAAWVERSKRCRDGSVGCSFARVFDKVATPPRPASDPSLPPAAGAGMASLAGWAVEPSPTGAQLYAVQGVDERNVLVAGHGIPVSRFDGTTWTEISTPTVDFGLWPNHRADIWGIQHCWQFGFFDGQTFSHLGCGGIGGADDPYEHGYGVWLADRTRIFGVGTQGTSKFGPPGGWQPLPTPVANDLWAVWGTSDRNVYAVGEFGTVLRYDGTSWSQVPGIPTGQSLNGIWGTSPSNIVAVGDFGTIVRFDGSAWSLENSGTTEHLIQVHGTGGSDVYAVGFNGTVLHFDGSTWQREAEGLTTNNLLGVAALCDKVFAVGDGGVVLGKASQCADPMFEDDFESTDVLAWCTSETDGGDLAVTAGAALEGTMGLAASIDDTSSLFVRDCLPSNEPRYRASVLLDPNGVDPGETMGHRRLRVLLAFDEALDARVITLVLRRLAGSYALRARVRRDDGTRANTAFIPISDAPHAVQFDWRRSDGPGSANGSFELWIDGVPVATLSNLDNDTTHVDAVRLGALSVKPGADGTLLLDRFKSSRRTFIP
jgi:hypothetical protein